MMVYRKLVNASTVKFMYQMIRVCSAVFAYSSAVMLLDIDGFIYVAFGTGESTLFLASRLLGM